MENFTKSENKTSENGILKTLEIIANFCPLWNAQSFIEARWEQTN